MLELKEFECTENTEWYNEKLEFYIKEITNLVDQILAWIGPKSCKCSYYPLRSTVLSAMNWEIWEYFRLLRNWNKDTIKELAEYILSNENNN